MTFSHVELLACVDAWNALHPTEVYMVSPPYWPLLAVDTDELQVDQADESWMDRGPLL